jgi:tripartite-type tricarboxylate transporter receptor subunit TctC
MLKRLSLLLLCLAAVSAAAADYPSRAIKMVVPFAPGGGTDVLGRIEPAADFFHRS